MGSIMSKIYDDMDKESNERISAERLERRRKFIEEVKELPYDEDVKWLWANRDKIIRNRKLIDLIG